MTKKKYKPFCLHVKINIYVIQSFLYFCKWIRYILHISLDHLLKLFPDAQIYVVWLPCYIQLIQFVLAKNATFKNCFPYDRVYIFHSTKLYISFPLLVYFIFPLHLVYTSKYRPANKVKIKIYMLTIFVCRNKWLERGAQRSTKGIFGAMTNIRNIPRPSIQQNKWHKHF